MTGPAFVRVRTPLGQQWHLAHAGVQHASVLRRTLCGLLYQHGIDTIERAHTEDVADACRSCRAKLERNTQSTSTQAVGRMSVRVRTSEGEEFELGRRVPIVREDTILG